jgi:hypothetical protein
MAGTVRVAVDRIVLVTTLATWTVTGTVTGTVLVVVSGTATVTMTETVVGIRIVIVDGTVTVFGATTVAGTVRVTRVDAVMETVLLETALVGYSIPQMTGCYLTSLPLEFMRAVADFDPEWSGSYFIARSTAKPPGRLLARVFPGLVYWKEKHDAPESSPFAATVQQDKAAGALLELLG